MYRISAETLAMVSLAGERVRRPGENQVPLTQDFDNITIDD